MNKVLFETTVASLISAVAVELTGLAINLISYKTTRDLLLAKQLYGGEWDGKQGFGLLLNRVYPFGLDPQREMKVTQWLEFDPKSLDNTLCIAFLIAFVLFFIVLNIKEKAAKRKKETNSGHYS